MTTRPRTLVRGGLLLAAFAAGLLFARPAAAHDGDPVITVDQAHPTSTSTHYIVKMVYDDDGDPITDASLTATPISPGGTEGALVAMEPMGEGLYQGEVPMAEPGTWKVRFTTVDPNGSMEHTQVVAGAPTTTAPAVSTTLDQTSTPPTTADIATDESASTDEGDDDSSSAMPLFAGGIVLLAAVGGGAAYAMSRNKPATPDDTPDAEA